MIVYNGISLDSVARVSVEDIRVSPIRYNPVVRPRAVRFGADFVRMGGGERTVTISFALLDKDPVARQAALLALSQWARTDAEYKLELPIEPLRYLTGVCTAKPEPSTRAWWENKLKMVFTCYDNPYWTAKGAKSVACGTQFNVLGNAPPLMRIEKTNSATVYNQAFGLDNNQMGFTTVPAGDMVIDLNRQTAVVGTNSIMQYYAPSGTFLIPRTGVQAVIGDGTVVYRERWE